MTLGELIDRLGGRLVQGNADIYVAGVEDAEAAGSLDVAFGEDLRTSVRALACHAGVVVVKPGVMPDGYPSGKNVVEFAEPRLWFAKAARLLREDAPKGGVHPRACVAADAMLESGVSVAAMAVVEYGVSIGVGTQIEAGAVISRGVQIGKHCHIHANVVLYPGTTLGDRVVVHAGAVLGADGFGYVRDSQTGAYTQFPQQGKLVIEDDVEIGANTTIDRGALKDTRIRRGTKIDNLVHIGHNCEVGEDVILVALTGISGSSTVGKGAVIAGQVGIGDHAHIGPGVVLGGQAGVLSGKTVTADGMRPGTVLWGTPARPLMQVLREQATLSRLAKEPRAKKPAAKRSRKPKKTDGA